MNSNKYRILVFGLVIVVGVLFLSTSSAQIITDPYVLREVEINGVNEFMRETYDDGIEIRFRQSLNGVEQIDRIATPVEISAYNTNKAFKISQENLQVLRGDLLQCETQMSVITEWPNILVEQNTIIASIANCIDVLARTERLHIDERSRGF